MMSSARVPTEAGEFRLCLYQTDLDLKEHLALVHGDVAGREGVLTRLHSECFTGDVLGSLRCDCGPQLHEAIGMIAHERCGVILYLRQEGRGIGLVDKLRAYDLQDEGYDTVDANLQLGRGADEREYATGAHILADLGVGSVDLITNNPRKVAGLEDNGIRVRRRIPLQIGANPENREYLSTKASRLDHLLSLDVAPAVSHPAHPGTPRARERRAVPDHRPLVTVAASQRLDARLVACPDRGTFHEQLRGAHDATMTGIGTILADDPAPPRKEHDNPDHEPSLVVVDSRLRLPLSARLLGGRSRPLLLVGPHHEAAKRRALEECGVRIIEVDESGGHLHLDHALKLLRGSGIRRLLVEGGVSLLTAFTRPNRCDFIALTLVTRSAVEGGPMLPALPALLDERWQQDGNNPVLLASLDWKS